MELFQQVIPVGAEPVKGTSGVLIFLFGFSARFWARRVKASGSGIGRRPTAERPEVLDADAGRRMLFMVEK